MANTFELPLAQPLRFFRQTDLTGALTTTDINLGGFNSNYNSRPFDADFFLRNLKDWQDNVIYVQPFQKGDKVAIYNRHDSSFSLTGYELYILDCKGDIVKTIPYNDTGVSNYTLGSVTCFKYDLKMWDLEEGIYYAQIKYANGTLKEYMISEPFEVKDTHEDTVLLTYTNSYNALNVLFDYASVTFQMRVHGSMIEMTPKAKVETYEDQPLNQTLLSGRPYREWQFILGGNGKPIPDYMADKVTRALCCDTLKIDDTLYTISEDGGLEASRSKNYPLTEWSIVLREKNNPDSVELSDDQGNDYSFGEMPASDRFYLQSITVAASPVSLEQQFTSQNSFLSFLQDWLITTYSLDLSIILTSDNEILALPNDATTDTWFSTNSPSLTGLLTNWIGLDIDTASAPTLDFQTGIAENNAVIWGDGTQDNMASTTTTFNLYSADGIKTCYYYFKDQLDLQISTDTGDGIITLDGQVITTLTDLTLDNDALKFINNRLFLQGDGSLNNLGLDGNKLPTVEVDKVIVMLLDAVKNGKVASSGGVVIDSQNPSAPPTSGSMAVITTELKTYWTVTTD